MNEEHSIDVVLPVLNPSEGWVEETLERKHQLATASGKNVRLIVVDDGSTSTAPFDALVGRDQNVRVIRIKDNSGKGAALRQGVLNASSDVILYTDADFPYTVESMTAITHAVENGVDIALGYREQDYYASVPWFRKGMSESFRFLLKRILHFPITDTQCGLKGMNRKGRDVFLATRINRFLVDMDFIKRAVRTEGLVIEPVVVKLRNDVTFSKMGLGVILREGVNFVRVLLT
ncbi:MAG: glycosyltransferase family 2 protein [Cryomorphaceae bacterium]